jgi:hypothetical protein
VFINKNKLIDAWKIYIINTTWKYIKENLTGYNDLEEYLQKNNIITENKGFLAKIMHSFKYVIPKKISNTFNQDGSATQEVEFGLKENQNSRNQENNIIDFNYIFNELDNILNINDCKVWIMMDRLDDAFPDKSEKSISALKSLLHMYKDICAYDNFKIKIFIRDDIYSQVTREKGFTSLSHVAANAMSPIKWNKEKLIQLLIERCLFNEKFNQYINENKISYNHLNDEIKDEILLLLFRNQVDIGKKNPDTIGWIINRITDGLDICTPRDFINILSNARQHQQEEWRLNNESAKDDYLIGPSSIKKAFKDISKDKIEVQLYAEYPELRNYIEKFRYSKSNHNDESLKKILGRYWKKRSAQLIDIGFIKEVKNYRNTWIIPLMYRSGLEITQGKAYEQIENNIIKQVQQIEESQGLEQIRFKI